MRVFFITSGDKVVSTAAAHFAGAVAIDDAALREIVGRHLEIDAVAKQNFDAVAAEASGEVGEHGVPVLQLDRKRGAGINLTDGPKDLERRFFSRLGGTI